MMKMRKGFTLVELLIVIIIIGILATAMLLSSGTGTNAAKAATIISDLRSMKTAALMFYIASQDNVTNTTALSLQNLLPFMDDPVKFQRNRVANFHNTGGVWAVSIEISPDVGLRNALRDRAATAGLYRTSAGFTNQLLYEGTTNIIYMRVR